jgi:hypothetical protein
MGMAPDHEDCPAIDPMPRLGAHFTEELKDELHVPLHVHRVKWVLWRPMHRFPGRVVFANGGFGNMAWHGHQHTSAHSS